MRRKEGNFSQNNNYGVAEKPTYLLILKQELTKIRETRQDVILPLTKHQTNSLQRHANKKRLNSHDTSFSMQIPIQPTSPIPNYRHHIDHFFSYLS